MLFLFDLQEIVQLHLYRLYFAVKQSFYYYTLILFVVFCVDVYVVLSSTFGLSHVDIRVLVYSDIWCWRVVHSVLAFVCIRNIVYRTIGLLLIEDDIFVRVQLLLKFIITPLVCLQNTCTCGKSLWCKRSIILFIICMEIAIQIVASMSFMYRFCLKHYHPIPTIGTNLKRYANRKVDHSWA